MQTIPAEVLTLLKSRRQVGANRPAYEVAIAGQPEGGVDLTTLGNTAYIPSGSATAHHSSSHLLNDGRVLVVWADGTDIKQGYADEKDALFANGSIGDITTLFANCDSPLCILSSIDAGLFLTVSWQQQNSDTTIKSLLYKSAAGDGSDWALHATLHSYNYGAKGDWFSASGITRILKSGSTYLIAYPSDSDYFGQVLAEMSIATSTDLINWTVRYTFDDLLSTIGSSQNFLEISGEIYWVVYDARSAGLVRLIKSDDYFVTNTTVFNIDVAYQAALHTPYIGCYLLYTAGRFYLSGVPVYTDPPKFSFWGCDLADIADYTKYTNDVWSAGVTNLGNLSVSIDDMGGGTLAVWSDEHLLAIEVETTELVVKSINIDRSRGASAAQATIVLDNKAGQYSPDSTGDWAGVLMPNALVTIKQGYGAELAQTFVGYIDSVEMTNFPAELRISCRDKGKLALDRIITNAEDGGHYKKYLNKTVEYIVGDLTSLCGLSAGTIEATGMTLTSKLFSWESYADAMEWLADISSSCWRVDELGVLHFTRDVMPVSPVTAYSFAEGEDIISLGYMISDQDLYYTATVYGTKDYTGTVNTSGVTVTWVSGDKFNTAWAEDKIITIDGSAYRIDAVASDTSLTVKATIGTKTGVNYQLADVIKASANFGAPLTYGLFSQKVLKIDAPDADTVAACQEIADRAVALMLCRCRVVDFAAIAVPWLQVGDFIQVTETTSTISELYRVTDISTSQGQDGFTMGVKCYWYGEVPS